MKCVIAGAGGQGRVVLDIMLHAGEHEIVGFVDSDATLTGKTVDGFPVLGRMADLPQLRNDHAISGAIIAIGDNTVRREFTERATQAGLQLVNAIHPSANIAGNVTLGVNVVVAAGAIICAHCRVGDSVILNTGCIVDHESMIGHGVHICPGARLAGRVKVRDGAFVGIGATVIQNRTIGENAIVGAGAVVIRDVAPDSTVVGTPARTIQPKA